MLPSLRIDGDRTTSTPGRATRPRPWTVSGRGDHPYLPRRNGGASRQPAVGPEPGLAGNDEDREARHVDENSHRRLGRWFAG